MRLAKCSGIELIQRLELCPFDVGRLKLARCAHIDDGALIDEKLR